MSNVSRIDRFLSPTRCLLVLWWSIKDFLSQKALYYERYHSGRRVAVLGKYLSHDLAFVAFGIVDDVP